MAIIYLALGLQIGKIAIAKFATIERCLRNAGHNGEIDARSSNDTLINLIIAIVEDILVRQPFA